MHLSRHFVPLLLVTGMLAGCGRTAESPSVELLLQNPLFAERYAEELVDVLTELEIIQDPVLEKENAKDKIASLKTDWLAIARDARASQRNGLLGDLLSMGAFTKGETLLTPTTLYFGPTLEVAPGPSLHVYLSEHIDPRDVEFPDASAIDLGVLPVPYGATALQLPKDIGDIIRFRTVVLWDVTLNRLYGFAQLSPA